MYTRHVSCDRTITFLRVYALPLLDRKRCSTRAAVAIPRNTTKVVHARGLIKHLSSDKLRSPSSHPTSFFFKALITRCPDICRTFQSLLQAVILAAVVAVNIWPSSMQRTARNPRFPSSSTKYRGVRKYVKKTIHGRRNTAGSDPRK